MLAPFGKYDALLHEFHHAGKADSPSGTALELAQALQGAWVAEGAARQPELVTGRLDRPRRPEELHLSSTRGGHIPGTHTVIFDSPADSIELTHRARTREGFAAGALLAAEWLLAAPHQGLMSFDDVLDDILASGFAAGSKSKPVPGSAARKR
ncbi:dihydrodipicolinate reductase C-terminal domain-containing protein [Deinococcus lacus]|uniref:dihydrodipicolinate reductase C-terminal domain-containing protein n=1 Tax=Deinococcus lacus TaxID=392561 RepID=UPI0036D2C0B2